MASSLEKAAFASQREQLLLGQAKHHADGVSALPDKVAAIAAALSAFRGLGVRHALIGGLAVGVRSGVPRATLDVNLSLESRMDRARLSECMRRHGFALRGSFAHSINFAHETGEPVQLAFDPSFDPMIAPSSCTWARSTSTW